MLLAFQLQLSLVTGCPLFSPIVCLLEAVCTAATLQACTHTHTRASKKTISFFNLKIKMFGTTTSNKPQEHAHGKFFQPISAIALFKSEIV